MPESHWTPTAREVVLRRILERTVRDEATGCLVWIGAVNAGNYGTIRVDNIQQSVHRLHYELQVGPIPSGMVLMHSCDNKLCCEPSHLTPGTQKENVHDFVQKRAEAGLPRRGPDKAPRIRRKSPRQKTTFDTPGLLEAILAKGKKVESGCIEWQAGTDPKGYAVVRVGGKTYRATRVIMRLIHGEFDPKLYVCHSCDNPSCINPDHLRLGTHRENTQEALERGRHPSRKPRTKKPIMPKGDTHYMRAHPEKGQEAGERLIRERPNYQEKLSGENHWTNRPENVETAERERQRVAHMSDGWRAEAKAGKRLYANQRLTPAQVEEIGRAHV